MNVLEALKHLSPLARFAVGLLVILTVPALCKKVRLPAVVGLMAAGVALGPNGLQVAAPHPEIAHFFADIGKLLLMFFAGLEMDLEQFHRVRGRAMAFGLLSFAAPLCMGLAIAKLAHYPWLSAVLIGAAISSHTLLGFPIVKRLGLMPNEAVTVAIAGTIFADVAALLVVAVCIPIHVGGFSTSAFVTQLVEIAVFLPVVLLGVGRVTKYLLHTIKPAKDNQLLILLLAVVVTALGAEVIHLEGIIGAFLAGLAVNPAVQDCEAKHDLEFMGNVLFIPTFFITIGFMIDVRAFAASIINNVWMVLGMVAIPLASKWAASTAMRRFANYSKDEGLLMWALSTPRVAATLAVALTAYHAEDVQHIRLIDEAILNCLLVTVVATSVVGPILTEHFGGRVAAQPARLREPER